MACWHRLAPSLCRCCHARVTCPVFPARNVLPELSAWSGEQGTDTCMGGRRHQGLLSCVGQNVHAAFCEWRHLRPC